MKEKVLVIIACVMSCVLVFSGIIFYKNHKKANSDIPVSPSSTEATTEENTSIEAETTTQPNEETTLEKETEKGNSKVVTTTKKPYVETTTAKNTQVTETTTVETTTAETTTEETTTEKIYPVLAESKADMIRLVNTMTAKASQGSYKMTRTMSADKELYHSNEDEIKPFIHKVDPNATFKSLMENYLGVGTTSINVVNGRPASAINEKYLLKATNITVDDVTSWRQVKNKIIVNIQSSLGPYYVEKITDDFVVPATFWNFFSQYTPGYNVQRGVSIGYGPLSIEMTIDDGNITEYVIKNSFAFDVMSDSGNVMCGAYTTETTYSNIVCK